MRVWAGRHGRRLIGCAALLAASGLLSVGAHAQATPKGGATLHKQALEAKLQAPAITQARKAMADLTRDPTFDAARAEALLADPQLDSVAREHLRFTLIHASRALYPPAPALEAYVHALSAHEDEVLTWHEEGPLAVPYFAIASAAKGTLTLWQRQRTAEEIHAAFRRGEAPSLTAYFTGELTAPDAHAKRYGVLDALGALPLQHLAGVREALLSEIDRSPGVEAPLALIAQKTADPTLFRAVFRTGRTPQALALVGVAVQTLPPDEAFEALKVAQGKGQLTSAALYALAPLVDRAAGVREYLLDSLADPAGGASAAAVIAASDDRLLLDAVASELADDRARDDRHRARLVLTLRLASTTSARQQLRASLADGTIYPSHLAEEVRAWLGE